MMGHFADKKCIYAAVHHDTGASHVALYKDRQCCSGQTRPRYIYARKCLEKSFPKVSQGMTLDTILLHLCGDGTDCPADSLCVEATAREYLEKQYGNDANRKIKVIGHGDDDFYRMHFTIEF